MNRSFLAAAVLTVMLSVVSVTFAAESVTPPAKAPSEKYMESYTTCGVGLDTSFILGGVTKNGFGFPTLSIGMSVINEGLDIRKFTNAPSLWVVQEAERRIMMEQNLSGEELTAKVAESITPSQFSYIQFGTVNVTDPLIGVGTWIPIKKGLNNNTYFDIGINYPKLVNIGIVYLF